MVRPFGYRWTWVRYRPCNCQCNQTLLVCFKKSVCLLISHDQCGWHLCDCHPKLATRPFASPQTRVHTSLSTAAIFLRHSQLSCIRTDKLRVGKLFVACVCDCHDRVTNVLRELRGHSAILVDISATVRTEATCITSCFTTVLQFLCLLDEEGHRKTYHIIQHSNPRPLKPGFDLIRPEQMAVKPWSWVHLRLPELYCP